MIRALFSKFGGYLIAAGAVFAVLFSWASSKKTEGQREERAEAKERDDEKAAEIRDRVERDLDDRLREFDQSGWRD